LLLISAGKHNACLSAFLRAGQGGEIRLRSPSREERMQETERGGEGELSCLTHRARGRSFYATGNELSNRLKNKTKHSTTGMGD